MYLNKKNLGFDIAIGRNWGTEMRGSKEMLPSFKSRRWEAGEDVYGGGYGRESDC